MILFRLILKLFLEIFIHFLYKKIFRKLSIYYMISSISKTLHTILLIIRNEGKNENTNEYLKIDGYFNLSSTCKHETTISFFI